MANIKPVIGICTRKMNKEFFPSVGAPRSYVEAVIRAGGIPVLMPFEIGLEDQARLLSSFDGVIFTGGGDLAVEFYGGTMSELVTDIDDDRDRFEMNLAKLVLESDLPVMGICRGLQLLNVAMGGTLIEDIPSEVANALGHPYVEGEAFDKLAHSIEIKEDSLLGELFGVKELQVNSLHHQGIRKMADRLEAVAWAPDGVIEGAVMQDRDFGVLVQWHPECLPEAAHAQALFAAFVKAAQKRIG